MQDDNCFGILKDGIRNKEIKLSYSEKNEYSRLFLFTQDFSESDSQHNSELEAIWKKIPIRASFNKSNFEIEKRSFWNFQERNSSSRALEFHYSQIADESVVKAWSDCMALRNNGFFLIIDEISDKIFLFKLFFQKPEHQTLKNIKIVVNQNIKLMEDSVLPLEIKSNQTAQHVYFSKVNEFEESFVAIEGSYSIGSDEYKLFIHQYIPPKILPNYKKLELEEAFYLGLDPIRISYEHERDPLNRVKGNFLATPSRLSINNSENIEIWNLYQEFNITDGEHRHHVGPGMPVGEGRIVIPNGIFSVSASFNIIGNKVKFIERPKFSTTCDHGLLNDGIDYLINLVWSKNNLVINI